MVEGKEAVRELLAGGRQAWDRFARDYRLVVLKAVHTAARRFRAGEADVEDAASQVFIELFQDDGSYKEISDQLGVPLNQVGMVLLRAREKLARVLKPEP